MSDEINKMIHRNYIYVQSHLATNKQITEALNKTFIKYESELEGISKEFEANIITKPDGTTYGYGYLWVRDEKLYYMLLGKNKDGSELYIEEEDENWKPDPKVIEERQKLMYGTIENKSWYEIMIMEEELDEKLKRPKIKKVVTSPISQVKYEYNEIQKKIDTTKSEDNFIFSQAIIRRKEDNYITYKLFSPIVNKNVTEDDLRKVFCKFSTSNYKNGEFYPQITIDKKRQNNTVTIKFDPMTNDGLFALLMTRKIVIRDNVVYFDYFKER
jgi:hypothetical protein